MKKEKKVRDISIFEDFVDYLREELLKGEKIRPCMIFRDKSGKLIYNMIDYSGKADDKIHDMLREVISLLQIDSYNIVLDIYLKMQTLGAPDMPILPASRYVDRKEALMIMNFNRDMTSKGKTIIYKKVDDKIEIETESDAIQMESRWNFYLEKEGIRESMSKKIKKQNDIFFYKEARKISDKYKSRFFEQGADKEAIAKEIFQAIKDKKVEIDKKLFEDTPEDN